MIRPDELIVDNFAGGGGASEGIEAALGRPIDIAINHDPEAIEMHRRNHPRTRHLCEDVWSVDIMAVTEGRPVGLAWFSPDCKHFSKAKGGKPVSQNIRGLAWVVTKWAELKRPRVIVLENVEEFQDWGPLLPNNKPDPARRGLTFRRWAGRLLNLRYRLEMRELSACKFGTPTIRKRLVIILRCDDQPIVWPEETHGPGLLPYRTAAECIDWSLPCPSIFLTREEGRKIGVKRPLVEATMRRMARGVKRYVIDAAEPFIVNLTHHGGDRIESIHEPVRTLTGAHRGEKALVTPFVTPIQHYNGRDTVQALDEPLRTITANPKGGGYALAVPTLVQMGYGEREGQAPRVPGIEKPLGTIVAGGGKHALVAAFLAQHNGGMIGHSAQEPVSTIVQRGTTQALVTAFLSRQFGRSVGNDAREPAGTTTARAKSSLVSSHLVKLRGTNVGSETDAPVHTISAGGTHIGEVRAFMMKYYGTDQAPDLRGPMATVTTKDRMALVMVYGEPYVIVDIGMRMLVPRELFRAQGFRDSYIIDGSGLTKTAQVKMCGNSVCPQMAEAVVRAQFEGRASEAVA